MDENLCIILNEIVLLKEMFTNLQLQEFQLNSADSSSILDIFVFRLAFPPVITWFVYWYFLYMFCH